MPRKPRVKPEITRIKLNPEQAVLQCDCYEGFRDTALTQLSGVLGGSKLCTGKGTWSGYSYGCHFDQGQYTVRQLWGNLQDS